MLRAPPAQRGEPLPVELRCNASGRIEAARQIGRGPPQQSARAGGIAARGMGHAHGELREGPPRLGLVGGRCLPRILEQLVRVKGVTVREERVGVAQRLGRRGETRNGMTALPFITARQGAAQAVPWPLVAGAAIAITVTASALGRMRRGHAPIVARARSTRTKPPWRASRGHAG